MRREREHAEHARLRSRYGSWAVVTGASSGIGRALAERVAEAGIHVVLVARRADVLDAFAEELRTRHGVHARPLAVDLATPDGAAAVSAATADLDVGLLVAAAGFGTSGRFVDASLERELAMLDVNCRALVALCHAFARRLADRRRGGMVLLASLVGFQGTPYAAHYAATKAYVQTLADALHVELAPQGVDVIASAPGPTDTGFAAAADMRMRVALAPDVVARATLRALGRRATVLPGLLTKVLTYSLVPLPRWARTRIMGGVMGRMTRHQRDARVARPT